MNECKVYTEKGIPGEPLPYKLQSDNNVIIALSFCFVLIIIALQNESKSLWSMLKSCIDKKERKHINTNNYSNSISGLPSVLLCSVFGILAGISVYHYFSYSNIDFFNSVDHTLILCLYTVTFIVFILCKLILYSFINWIFFNKENNRLWKEDFMRIISCLSIILFPAIIYIVFLDTEFHYSAILIITLILISKILLFYKCFMYFFRNFYGFIHLILYFCALEIVPDLFLWKGIELINCILILKL